MTDARPRCDSHASRRRWCCRPDGHQGVHWNTAGRRWNDAEETHRSRPPDLTADLLLARRAIEVAAAQSSVTVDQLLGPWLERPVVDARHVAAAVVRQATRLSYPQIGQLLDRHHSTVIAAERRVGRTPSLAERAGRIRAAITGGAT